MKYIGVDLGGTNITAAVLNEKYEIIAESKRKTACPRSWQAILDDVADAVTDVAQKVGVALSDFAYLGVGSPGVINVQKKVVIDAVNLGFKNVPLGVYLENKLGIPVLLENDANAAAYGEFNAVSACGANNFVAFTIGTGIGSGIIINGHIYRGSNGVAGELGHTVICMGGRPCSCGRRGCMDVYASATGLITTTKEIMIANKESLMWQLVDGDLNTVNGATAFMGAKQGDIAAQKAVDLYVEALSACIINVINIFQPDMISLAGGISREGETLLMPIRALIQKESLKNPMEKEPHICAALLQDKAGVIGAALLGKAE